MKNSLKITFLGTGSALGVPQLGCSCSVCHSTHPYNKRRRTAFLLEKGSKKFLLDPGPDIRQQLLDHPIKHLDGVIITHAHHDHIGGYDDLRVFAVRQKGVIPTLIHEKNVEELKTRCGYLFRRGYTYFSLDLLKDDQGQGSFQGLGYRYLTYVQNGMNVSGFVLDELAFVSDIQVLDEGLVQALQGVKTLVVSCLYKPQGPVKSHLNLEELVDLKYRTGVKQMIITHMGHDINYLDLSQTLDSDILLSYDGFIYEV